MAGELITADYEVEFRGLLMGGSTAFNIKRIEGLLEIPDLASGDQGRLRRHGLRAGDDFVQGRRVVVTLDVVADTEAEFSAAVAALRAATSPGAVEAPFVFRIPSVESGVQSRVNVRARRRSLPVTQDFYYGQAEAAVELFATDPRVYSDALVVETTTLPSGSGGFAFPMTFPLTFGATSVGGELMLTNAGSFDAPVVFRIDGPVLTPRIVSVEAGAELKFNLSLAEGEFLTVDTDSRKVLLGGTASRYSALSSSSSWFDLVPGPNQISFRGVTATTGKLSAAFRSASV